MRRFHRYLIGAVVNAVLLLMPLCPVVADESPVDRMIEQAKQGTITPAQLADALLVQAEIDQAAIPSPDTLVIRFSGFADLIGEKLLDKTAQLIREGKMDGARQLEKFSERTLGTVSTYTREVANLNRLNDQFERLVSRGTVDTVLAFRESLQTKREKELFLQRVDDFLKRIVRHHATKEPPMQALRSLALFGDAARAAGADQIILDLLQGLVKEAQQGTLAWANFTLNDRRTEKFLLEMAEDKPEVLANLLAIYEFRTKALVRANNYEAAEDSFQWVVSQRPDPNERNNQFRRELASLVSGTMGKMYATKRVEELGALEDLGSFEEIYYYFRGFYGEGVLVATFLVTVGVLFALFAGLFVAGKYVPALRMDTIPERFEKYRRKRLENKMRKRGVGYMSAVQADDEYSRLLSEFGLDDNATLSDIKKAYRKLVKEHHPDAHGTSGQITDEDGNIDRTFEELKKNYQRLLDMRESQFGR